MKLKDFLIDSFSGSYTYRLDNTYYNLYNYDNRYWVVYETKEIENGMPFNWMVINTCSTLKECKEILKTKIFWKIILQKYLNLYDKHNY